MMILKCKMCGGDIIVNENQTYGTCDSCGSTMTLPKIDDERRANAFNRANHLRRQNDFDKAISAYERILNEDNTDAEAHWGIVLSRYGIEYVEDPKTHERIPTCHRIQTNSILADIDYLAAIEHASDVYTRSLYEEEAKRIFGIQKEILAISNREDSYDVFICYKETNGSGTRTKDSAIAQDVYYQLKNEGYKVFFSRITLEDKLGQQYEPYIFAALNSAKVMVVIGTKRENYEAVWVKNEWLRYLDLMKKDRSKLLIPCYNDMDAYDLPEELSMLQSQDMSKIGFIQDLIRGVKKVVETGNVKPLDQTASKSTEAVVAPSVISLYERGKIILEDKDWTSASEYFDRVLDIDPKFAPAYVGKLCVQTQKISEADLVRNLKPLTEYGDYLKAIRFADSNNQKTLDGYNQVILDRIEYERQDAIYQTAISHMYAARSYRDRGLIQLHDKVGSYYNAQKLFGEISTYKLSTLRAKQCETIITVIETLISKLVEEERLAHEMQRLERERIAEEQRIKTERFAERQRAIRKKWLVLAVSTLITTIVFLFVLTYVIIPNGHYADAKALLANEDYEAAVAEFAKAGGYKDSRKQVENCLSQLRVAIVAGGSHTVSLKADGTVVAVGSNMLYGQCDVAGWQDIVAISAGDRHTIGLKADGTVAAVGYNADGQCYVNGWQNVEAISAGYNHTVGLKADGTVVAVGDNWNHQCDVAFWQNIMVISAGGNHTVGLKADGTVVAIGANWEDQCNVTSWRDIVVVSAGGSHTVGLKADGTVVAEGNNEDGQCDVDGWQNIVAISAGYKHTVGLKADGTVVATGSNEAGQCNVAGWQDIAAITAGGYHTIGVKANGALVAEGDNKAGQCDVAGWKLW